MGGSFSASANASVVSRCDDGAPANAASNSPPPMRRVLTVEEKMWEKVRCTVAPVAA